MWTDRVVALCVISGITAFADGWIPIQAAEPAKTPRSPAPAPQKPAASAAVRPLTAADVWDTDYARAWQRAKKQGRPVLLHFHATWCAPCRQMERDVLNSPDVLRELNTRCVAVKVDCDQQPVMVEQFGVEALPCDILVTPDGKMHRLNMGVVSAREYTSLISNFGKGRSPTTIDVSSN